MIAAGVTQLQTPPATQNTGSVAASTQSTNKRQGPTNHLKWKKSKRSKHSTTAGMEEDGDEQPVFDPAQLKASNKTAIELRCLAVKFAMSGLTETVLESVLAFHEEIETMIAIKALELGVTVSDIEKVFGKYVGIRRPSAWNRFLQSPNARAIFKEARGIGDGKGMKLLSQVWKNMTQEEKDVYKEATQAADSTTLNTLEQGLEEVQVGPQRRQAILHPRSNVVINPRNLVQYKHNAETFMDEMLAKCIPVAKTNHFEVVLIAVSTHIGKHNFQITRNTAGVTLPVKMIYDIEGVQNFPAQLQALLVGKTTLQLADDLADKTAHGLHARVVKSLSRFLHGVTGLNHWPWSRCDKTLGDLGFELKLLPGARSQLATFKTPSNTLNQAKLLALESDLNDNMIHLVRTADNLICIPNPICAKNTKTQTCVICISSTLSPISLLLKHRCIEDIQY
ncbi:hypothetical protein DFH28DRAFT_1086086 [Melampsora americana]|nr:hypothetical protein DFH28DRAFT_1086086 [Melampsora americana]